ncbi:hypothetical protein GCM10009547_47810 [Sporichthya brevicatena]|uniref:Uncharacterized protein n=1 Tax=Sporichthya brevicatena TaxID=171442 RepID=A0ABN1HCN4_9ACTN
MAAAFFAGAFSAAFLAAGALAAVFFAGAAFAGAFFATLAEAAVRAVAARAATVRAVPSAADKADSGGMGVADTNYLPTIEARPEGAPVELGAVTFRRTAF